MITVMKFGGTSVGSPEALKRVANIIVGEEGSRVVVVSAMSGITNFLVNMVDDPTVKMDEAIEAFKKKHMDVAEHLFEGKVLEAFNKEFDIRFKNFCEVVTDPHAADNPYHKDCVTSQGERFSSLLLSFVLVSMGYESVALTSEQAGIGAAGKPLNGCADLMRTETGMSINVKPLIDAGVIPIITGFYGISPSGDVVTFGRGGSDYSAAVVANAIDADLLEIWTDVDGFMSADPRIIKDAVKIDEMNFGEAAELAYFGAKVLHPRTIEPVRMKHIPLKVRNSFNPQEPGTLIHHLRKPKNDLLRSVAVKTDLSIITISSAEIAYRPAMVARIIDKIAEINVIMYAISTSLSTVALLIHNLDVKATLMQLNTLRAADIERIDVKSNVALICAVGDNLLSKCGVSSDIFAVVKEAEANVEMISEGASDVSLNFVVPMDRMVNVVTGLHTKYVRGMNQ
jgi:aspartate kinase